MVVIALNTVALSMPELGDNDQIAQEELAWLDATLAQARQAGQKAWILMHVPPGAYVGETVRKLDSAGHLSSAVMMLNASYQAQLLQTLLHYPDVVTLMLAAHTHMDEFRNITGSLPLSPVGSLEITPGITPYFNNNPAFKIYTFENSTFAPLDYQALNYDLALTPAQFQVSYAFSTAYFGNFIQGLLEDALAALYPVLDLEPAKQQRFRTNYYSGNNALNPITDANWKVYDCGIVTMTEQEIIDCVNGE